MDNDETLVVPMDSPPPDEHARYVRRKLFEDLAGDAQMVAEEATAPSPCTTPSKLARSTGLVDLGSGSHEGAEPVAALLAPESEEPVAALLAPDPEEAVAALPADAPVPPRQVG